MLDQKFGARQYMRRLYLIGPFCRDELLFSIGQGNQKLSGV
jgi:hypothetical protein